MWTLASHEPVEVNTAWLRHGTKLRPVAMNIIMNFGGLGDMIARTPAVLYLVRQNPHVEAKLWCPDYFIPLAKRIYAEEPRITPRHIEEYRAEFDATVPVFDFPCHPHSSFATNMTRHAFNVLVNKEAPDSLMNYPALHSLDPTLATRSNYIVITCNYTALARRMFPEELAKLAKYFLSIGYEVKILGATKATVRTDKGDDKTRYIYAAAPSIDVEHPGLTDLRDQTTLLEAADILNGAHCTLGVDNGLLHLAACTNSPIVMGMTSVAPEHRTIYRGNKLNWRIRHVTPKESLACRFCQSRAGVIPGHSFKVCFYGDYRCCEDMTAGKFIKAYTELGL